jgi:ATP-dependent DNA helicase PIF1
MRLQCGSSEIEKKEMAEFSSWILDIGEGRLGNSNDGITDIEIPQDLLLTNFDDPILAIVNRIYPDILDNYLNYDFLSARVTASWQVYQSVVE